MAKFKLAIQEETKDFEVVREGSLIRVHENGETAVFHLIHQDEHTLLLEQKLPDGRNRQLRIAGTKQGDKRSLWVNGRTLQVERVRQRNLDNTANDSSLAATIPAIVTEILVDIGTHVAAGDRLILLESMKMVIPIQAPYDGTITAVHCTVGESVQAGIQLIDIEKEAAP